MGYETGKGQGVPRGAVYAGFAGHPDGGRSLALRIAAVGLADFQAPPAAPAADGGGVHL
ncbi:hypothetical protein [Streptomyces sp. NPDC090445]|uniref:hypothetical protein n=1 Tax=Streptomyces sp. NPDC090445 TaxID=3365963 RepID=UPI00380FEA09